MEFLDAINKGDFNKVRFFIINGEVDINYNNGEALNQAILQKNKNIISLLLYPSHFGIITENKADLLLIKKDTFIFLTENKLDDILILITFPRYFGIDIILGEDKINSAIFSNISMNCTGAESEYAMCFLKYTSIENWMKIYGGYEWVCDPKVEKAVKYLSKIAKEDWKIKKSLNTLKKSYLLMEDFKDYLFCIVIKYRKLYVIENGGDVFKDYSELNEEMKKFYFKVVFSF